MVLVLLKYCNPQEVWNNGEQKQYYIIDKDKVSDIALEYNIVTDFKAKSHFILEITYAHLDELFKIDDAYDSEFLIKTKS